MLLPIFPEILDWLASDSDYEDILASITDAGFVSKAALELRDIKRVQIEPSNFASPSPINLILSGKAAVFDLFGILAHRAFDRWA